MFYTGTFLHLYTRTNDRKLHQNLISNKWQQQHFPPFYNMLNMKRRYIFYVEYKQNAFTNGHRLNFINYLLFILQLLLIYYIRFRNYYTYSTPERLTKIYNSKNRNSYFVNNKYRMTNLTILIKFTVSTKIVTKTE